MIELSIDRENCPETSAKRRYEEYMRQYLRGEENDELESRIELLHKFLISTDFRKVRCEGEKYLLRGGKEIKLRIHSLGKGEYRTEWV
jgi:hypothetical protein